MSEAITGPRAQARPTRRTVLRIVAACAALPLSITGIRATAPKAQGFDWYGQVLGADSRLTLWHTNPAFARATILKARIEIDRLERIFSLYRSDSEIARLNAAGKLAQPSPELRGLIEQSRRLSELSHGAFDITVQPLWRLYEAHFWTHTDSSPDILAKAHDVARSLVDYRRIDSGKAAIGFSRDGMAITLNSLAQGFITDTITDLLRAEGFESAMVDLGEYRAVGRRPDGWPWHIGISNPAAPLLIGRRVELDGTADEAALAVSGGYGTKFEPSGRFHHIFDPASGASANRLADAVVLAPTATIANGLSTALYVAGEAQAPALLAAYPRTRAFLTRPDGTSITVTAKGSVTV